MSFLFVLLSLVSPMLWAAPTLKLGMPAPRLADQTWIQGKPFKTFQKGHVYVIDFWATTCAPCVKTLPHLAELSRSYGDDVHFVGVAAEIDTETSVKEFLAEMTPPIDFAMTLDANATAWEQWLEASGAMGIPSVFVIDRDGMVAYIGYPTLLDSPDQGHPLAQIVAGTWRQSKEFEVYADKFTERAEQSAKLRGVYAGMQTAQGEGDWTKALKVIEVGISIASGYHRADLELHRAELLTHHFGRGPEAAAAIPKIVEALWDNPQMLGRVLELMIEEKLGAGSWNFELGHRVALRIASLVEFNPKPEQREALRSYQALLLPPVSKFYFVAGLPALAVHYQQRAIESAQEAGYDPADLVAEFGPYETAARTAPTNWGETLCADGRCFLQGPNSTERKILDRLLALNPRTEADVAKLFEDGHLRVEAAAAPAYLKDIPGGPAESALYAVATNPIAPTLLRKASIVTLGVLKANSADLFLRDLVESALEESPKASAPTLLRELLPTALDALEAIGRGEAGALRERCEGLLDR